MRHKQRTREHIIADLGANHVERKVLLTGHVVELKRHDYGIDLSVSTFDDGGDTERGEFGIQVKATESVKLNADGTKVCLRLDRRDFRAWFTDPLPVLVVLYDVSADRAYWIHVQQHLKRRRKSLIGSGPDRVTIHIPTENVFDEDVVREIVDIKRRMMPRMLKATYGDE